MLASASPRNPYVAISSKSSNATSLLVVKRSHTIDMSSFCTQGSGERCKDSHTPPAYLDTMAIVLDLKQLETSALDDDSDGSRASIERVLDQLLQRGSRPMHNLACSDAVHDNLVQLSDGRRGLCRFRGTLCHRIIVTAGCGSHGATVGRGQSDRCATDASSRAVACTHVMMDEDILAQSHKLWAYGQLQSQSSARCPAAGTMFKPLSYAASSCRRHVQPYKWARNPGSRLVAHPVRRWTVEPALPSLGTGRLISTCVARCCGVSPSKCDETDDHWFVRSLSKTFATHPGVSAAYVLGLDLVNAGLMYFVIKAVGMSWLCSHAPL